MNNPAPRPALRKADDAHVHPAAPRPARSPRAARTPVPAIETAQPAPVTSVVPKAKPLKAEPSARKRKFSGSTSDHMRIPEMATEVAESASRNRREGAPRRPAHDTFFGDAPVTESAAAAPSTESASASAPAPASVKPAKDVTPAKTAKPAKGPNLMSGKSVELDVEVPKELRKAAKVEAKKRGLDLDTVVVDLLHAWVTDAH